MSHVVCCSARDQTGTVLLWFWHSVSLSVTTTTQLQCIHTDGMTLQSLFINMHRSHKAHFWYVSELSDGQTVMETYVWHFSTDISCDLHTDAVHVLTCTVRLPSVAASLRYRL